MSRIKIGVVVGTRPEIIKMQPIIKAILKNSQEYQLLFIHTGQHYEWNMSQLFINQLELPEPNYFLNVKSGSHGIQTARILTRCEKVFKKEKPDIVLVEGDTNSALGAALAATKIGISVGHVEAGCRSFDRSMPEEINRVLIADLTSMHFAPTKTCIQNLIREGIPKTQIYLTGHPIVDLLSEIKDKLSNKILERFELKEKQYYFLTLHRIENIEDKNRLEQILQSIAEIAKIRAVIFPVHPHTHKCIRRFKLEKYLKNLTTIEPVGYIESLSLIKFARIILTDSGGVQQEAALLGTPCITLRKNTEWIETVDYGVNFLAYSNDEIIKTLYVIEDQLLSIVRKFEHINNIFGKPVVSYRILKIIENSLGIL